MGNIEDLEIEGLMAELAAKRRQYWQHLRHPDPRDPEYVPSPLDAMDDEEGDDDESSDQ